MRIHADFSQTAIITPEHYQWVKSPGGEVKRMMLDRIGEEKARATSIVEFAENSEFPEHAHPLGEEVLVLSGTFTENQDEHYPVGWYMRNPHQSAHQVSSKNGCKIFVKLMQMTEDELQPTRINTHDPKNWLWCQERYICPLYEAKFEKTFLEQLKPQQMLSESYAKGIEIFILSGELQCNESVYPTGTWLRLAQDNILKLYATITGARLYVKTGHLQHAMEVWA